MILLEDRRDTREWPFGDDLTLLPEQDLAQAGGVSIQGKRISKLRRSPIERAHLTACCFHTWTESSLTTMVKQTRRVSSPPGQAPHIQH